MSTEIAEKTRELASKAKVINFAEWDNLYSQEVLQIFEQADTERRYLDNADLQKLQVLKPELQATLEVTRTLRDEVIEIVFDAHASLLSQFPTIAEPGGDLYPPVRAESCLRDLWHFLRYTTYGIAAQNKQFSSPEGLRYLELLYQELHVPLDAMILGLVSLKVASLLRCPGEQYAEIEVYFDHLIGELKRFKAVKATLA